MARKAKETPSFVYPKVTLKGTRPAIRRRLRLPFALRLDRRSDALLRGMGWRGGHDPEEFSGEETDRRVKALATLRG